MVANQSDTTLLHVYVCVRQSSGSSEQGRPGVEMRDTFFNVFMGIAHWEMRRVLIFAVSSMNVCLRGKVKMLLCAFMSPQSTHPHHRFLFSLIE